MDIKDLKFDNSGLIPCIVQDIESNKVLMMAYMNKESIEISLKEQITCFWSRSRQELWRKGQTSGNIQHLVSLTSDCDGDTLLAKVKKDGPACHTGEDSCFFQPIQEAADNSDFTLTDLYQLLEQRQAEPKEGSYTTYLFEKGREKILKKIGEESSEVTIGAMKDSREEMIYEIGDLAYHIMVLMVDAGIKPADIKTELAKRHVIDKKVKQETMK
jgi:phosphoribosyl-AMP cyclohydrolase / phosphoribosyl-ATP pyrophosphohydrolase